MAFKIGYVLLADSVQEVKNGKLNILGIFDRVFIEKPPEPFQPLVVIVRVVGETEDELGKHHVIIRLNRPGNKTAAEIGGDVVFTPKSVGPFLTQLRVVLAISGVIFKEYGVHKIVVLVDGEVVGEQRFSVETPSGSPDNAET